MLTEKDIQLFEYIHHIYYENKTGEELCFSNHVSSGFVLNDFTKNYYNLIWKNFQYMLKNKKVLDIGCEFGSKINWFESAGVEKYTGVEPNEKNFYYSNIVKNIVDMPCTLYNKSAESFEYSYFDTGCLLSVTHHLDDEDFVIQKLADNCNNLLLDTWTEKYNCKKLTYYVDLVSDFGHKVVAVNLIKNNRYFIASSKS